MPFLLFLIDDRRIWIQEAQKHTHPDPQHCLLRSVSAILSRSLILGFTTKDFSENDGSVLKIQWAL
jgi:hypothetical protein